MLSLSVLLSFSNVFSPAEDFLFALSNFGKESKSIFSVISSMDALSSVNARKSGRIRLEFSSQFTNIILLYYFCSGLAWQSSEQTEDPNLAWTGMMETENEAVRDRLGDLERKVHRQNDEIVCLKATLADCLRRLNSLEVDKVRYHVPNALFDIFVVPT